MFDIGTHDIAGSLVNSPRLASELVPARKFRLDDAITRVPSVVRSIAQTAVWGIAYQIVAALVQLVCLGYLIRLVGREQFGLWMVIYALTMWAPLLMFGQGNLLLTRLGQTIFADSGEAQRTLASCLAVCLAGAGVALSVVFIAIPLVPWQDWLHIQNVRAMTEAVPTAIAAGAVAILAVPASLSSFAMLAGRRGVINHQVMIAAQLLCLAIFLLGISLQWPLWALGSILVAPVGLAGMTLFVVGIRNNYFPLPEFALVSRGNIEKTLVSALTIFSFDVATVFLQRTPELIVVRLRGIDEVAALGAGNRLSLFLLAIIQALLMAVWPTISEAASRNDWRWIKRALVASLTAILLIWGAGSTAIWFLGPFFIEKWTGIPHLVSGALFVAIIFQALSQGLQSWIFTALSALSMYRTQLLAVVGAIAVYFVLAPILGQPWGAVGVVFAQSAGILLFALPVGVLAVARCIRHGATSGSR